MATKKKTYTKANIDEDTLYDLFGIELGFIDCSIHSMKQLEEAVDNAYNTEEAIIAEINNFDIKGLFI